MALKDEAPVETNPPGAKPEEAGVNSDAQAQTTAPSAEKGTSREGTVIGRASTRAAAEARSPSAPGNGSGAAPSWISVLFFVGLLLLYLGQRVILKWELAASGATWGGVAAMLASTVARFTPLFRGRGGHRRVARLLDGLQLLGLIGIALFALTTPAGIELLGWSSDASQRAQSVLSVAWIVCVLVSTCGLLFAELSLHPMRDAAHLEERRVRAAAVSGTTLALAASYCALFVYAAAQQEAQVDFSYFKTSEPGEATVKLAQKTARPVQVTAFFPAVNQVRKEVEGYLKQLQERSGNLEYSVVDRYLEPALAKELKVVSDGVIVLALDDGSKSLSIGTAMDKARSKLIKLDSSFHEKLLELATSRRNVYLTTGHGELNDSERGVERAEGRSARIAKELLQHQNFRVRDLGLSQGLGKEVPEDADAVMVLGPTLPFAPEELAALERYADRGGKLLLALDTDSVSTRDVVTPATDSASRGEGGPVGPESSEDSPGKPERPTERPSNNESPEDNGKDPVEPAVSPAQQWLVDLAATVGARLVPSVLADPVAHVVRRNDPSDRVIMPSNRFSSHASVSTLSRNSARAAVVVMGSSYLEEADLGKGKPVVALRSLPSAFADQNGDYQMSKGETKRAFNLAVALSREVVTTGVAPDGPSAQEDSADTHADTEHTAAPPAPAAPVADDSAPEKAEGAPEQSKKAVPDEMRAFVLADADALSDLLLERVVGNQMLLVDAMRWLVGEESLAGEISSEEDVRVEHSKQEDVAWFYSTIFGVPTLVLGLGVWTSRRARRGKGKAPPAAANQQGAVS